MTKPSTIYHLPSTKSRLKVAIVHDWLVGGGAELVVEQLHKMYPEAPIYTSYCTREWRERLDGKVVTGWLQYLGKIRKFIPVLRIWWFTRLNLDYYDLIISSSGAEAKGIRLGRWNVEDRSWLGKLRAFFNLPNSKYKYLQKPLHINYCHAPTHYYWARYEEYLKKPGFGPFDWLARLGLRLLVAPLRRWDIKAAQRPDFIIANSQHTQAEIKKYYGRPSVVIHPPVYYERFQKAANQHQKRHGFLISGRQTPYKKFDLAVKACSDLDLPLTVIGDGPDHDYLRKIAGSSITFLGKVSDEVLEEEFARAQALIFPGTDDFGITAVEALAAGTPIIAYKAGGALDYVRPGITGEFFDEPRAGSLAETLKNFKPEKYYPKDCRLTAQTFSSDKFRRNMEIFIHKVIEKSDLLDASAKM